MNNREKIEYLKQYKNLDKHIDQLLEEKVHWKLKAEKITQTLSGMPTGSDGENQRELAICKMIDVEWEATAEIDRLVDLRREIKTAISKIPDQDLQLLIRYRYISGMTFEEISCKMHYSWQHIHRLHSKALKEIML